jgi:hypothetical protein
MYQQAYPDRTPTTVDVLRWADTFITARMDRKTFTRLAVEALSKVEMSEAVSEPGKSIRRVHNGAVADCIAAVQNMGISDFAPAPAVPAPALKWQAFNGPLPNGQGKLLVTNNLTATDARGHKSHVWVVDMVHANEHYGIFAFDTEGRKAPSFLTHFIKLEDVL